MQKRYKLYKQYKLIHCVAAVRLTATACTPTIESFTGNHARKNANVKVSSDLNIDRRKETIMQTQDILNRLEGVKTNGTNKWIARCPCSHNHAHGDKNRSLTVALNGTKILLHCHTGCTTDDICGAIGIEGKDLFTDAPQGTIERTIDERRQSFIEWFGGQNGLRFVVAHSYCYGEYGDGLMKIKYQDADGKKTFRWIHDDPTTQSGFKLNHEGCAHRLYFAGDPDAAEVFIVEGEKDADTLHSITGKTVVSAENGAQKEGDGDKWLSVYTEQLAGKTVVILHDNDAIGRAFAHIEADAVAKKAKSVRLIDIATAWKECPEKGDVSDMVAALGKQDTLTRLQTLVNNAAEWRTTLDIPTEAQTSVDTQDAVETENNAVVRDSVELFDSFMGKIQTEAYKPLKTGMTDFDRLLGGGIMKQSLVILSAAPGTGKTTLAQQIFETMAKDGNDVVFLNLEMSREQLLARSVSRIVKRNGGTLTASGILQGYSWTDTQRRQATEAADEYRTRIAPKMHYNPDGCTTDIQAITDALTREANAALQAGKRPPVVVLDYLHLVTSSQREEQSEIVKKTVAALKDYAIKYDTFVFAISATNRTSNASGTISLDSGRDSSAIEYTADIALSLNYAALHDKERLTFTDGNGKHHENEEADARNPDHMEYLQRQKPRKMLVQVLKNRMSEPGGKLYLAFDAAYSKFTPIVDGFFPTNEKTPFEAEPTAYTI